jgi:hypothetical protein
MTNSAPTHWAVPAPNRARVSRRPGKALARWSVFLGIQSVVMGVILPIPILAIVLGIVALARGTALPGRAVIGIAFGATFLPVWCGFIAICIWSYNSHVF